MNYIKILWLATLYGGTVYGQSPCSSLRMRPEIRDLTIDQLQRFLQATKTLKARGVMNNFTKVHLTYEAQAHGIPAFLPWHREFLIRYERALQSVDPSINLPYWDWTRDSQFPELSRVFQLDYFGGNGRQPNQCLMDGPFADWVAQTPNQHCLQRNYDHGVSMSPFYNQVALEGILSQSKTFDEFRTHIEGAPHGRVHVSIGGDISTMYSPNDPLFYLHHGFIDMLWYEWQMRNPELSYTYDGFSPIKKNQASVSDRLVPFNIPVYRALSTKAAGYCYEYQRYQLPAQDFTLLTPQVTLNLRRSYNPAGPKPRTCNKLVSTIRVPKPLPVEYIQKNHLNLTSVRRTEKLMSTWMIRYKKNAPLPWANEHNNLEPIHDGQKDNKHVNQQPPSRNESNKKEQPRPEAIHNSGDSANIHHGHHRHHRHHKNRHWSLRLPFLNLQFGG